MYGGTCVTYKYQGEIIWPDALMHVATWALGHFALGRRRLNSACLFCVLRKMKTQHAYDNTNVARCGSRFEISVL